GGGIQFQSASNIAATEGSPLSFQVQATSPGCCPNLDFTLSSQPAWLTLAPRFDGAWILSGTPPSGSAGTYTAVIIASNGVTHDRQQTLTLTVNPATPGPAITSPADATITAGSPANIAITTSGFAAPPTITAAAVPVGLTFTDNHDGTASLAGTT